MAGNIGAALDTIKRTFMIRLISDSNEQRPGILAGARPRRIRTNIASTNYNLSIILEYCSAAYLVFNKELVLPGTRGNTSPA